MILSCIAFSLKKICPGYRSPVKNMFAMRSIDFNECVLRHSFSSGWLL